MTLSLRFAARSHIGLLRQINQDSVYAGPRLLAVADGMGGHAAGEVASAVAIAAIAPLDDDAPGTDLLDALREAALVANQHLRDMVEGDPALEGMGTTLTAILSAGSRLGLMHIGDSRCYLLRDGELSQITHDHSLVQTLIDEGRITEEEASSHPQRSVITRVLDGRPDLEVDLSVREVREGDRYLICSDGLTGPVGSRDTLTETLSIADPQEAVDRLVQLALRGGGPDNITAIVADAIESEAVPHPAPVVAGAAAEAPQEPPPGVADSAASRARTAEGRDVPDPVRSPPPTTPALSGRGRRRAGVLIAVLAVLALVGSVAAWSYIRTQYYVGADASQVAIFRGVSGSVAGLDLSSVSTRSDLSVHRLGELDAARVEKGIVAKDRADAERIVKRLTSLAVACPTTAPNQTPSPTRAPRIPTAPAGASPSPAPAVPTSCPTP